MSKLKRLGLLNREKIDGFYGTNTNCYNTGTVIGRSGVGGVFGSITGSAANCYNKGIVMGTSDGTGMAEIAG